MQRRIAWLALCFALGCGARGRGGPPDPAGTVALRFPHAQPAHAALVCTACHAEADVRAGRPARPGTRDHAPCDQSGCHAREFTAPPGPLCGLCHEEVAPWQEDGTTLAPYPPVGPTRAAPSQFSHALHLDKQRMDRALGFHVACSDCHAASGAAGDYAEPGHAACARCHDRAEELRLKIDLADCNACHLSGAAQVPRARRLIRGDVRFRHINHEADRQGRGIACIQCHRAIGAKARLADRATPEMAVCVGCHGDSKRTPEPFGMGQCGACHDRPPGAGLDLVAPRSHLPERDKPDSHTLAFRKDHGADARRDPAGCATCHTGMSGRRENCDDCHMSMRPSDHVPAWSELTHGSDAAADAQRGATCHQGDVCTTCHARRPRSHQPRIAWAQSGDPSPAHAFPARQNLRSCLTCHDFETTCALGGCHAGEAAPRWVVP